LDVTQLKRIPLFADVSEEALRTIAPFATVEEWPEGKEIVREGGFSNHFYAIEEGTAKVERDGQKLADLGAGDVFGEQGLLERSERSATVTATSPVKLIKIEHWELSRMKKAMPEAYNQLVAKVEAQKSSAD
jgi:cAMP-dependent protein kinase regulator